MSRAGRYGGYLFAAALGAVVGGVAVVSAMRAVPRLMAGMMRRMMESMGMGETRRRLLAGFGEAQSEQTGGR